MFNLPKSCVLASLIAASPLAYAEAPARPDRTVTAAPQAVPNGIVYRDLRYGDESSRGNLLDLYLPADRSRPVPLIIWIHGGGWIGGDKSPCYGAPEVLRLGYAVASINYRLTDEAAYPAQIHDCKGAVRWLRSMAGQFNIDPDRFGVWGESAGGHLGALLGTTAGVPELEGTVGGNAGVSSSVQAVLDWFGPTDLPTIAEQIDPAKLPREMSQEPTLLTRLLGGRIEEKAQLARTASPLRYVRPESVPFLIMHGTQDALVPLAQSEAMHSALKAAGVESQLIVIRGAGHGGMAFLTPGNLATIRSFFERHLKAPAK